MLRWLIDQRDAIRFDLLKTKLHLLAAFKMPYRQMEHSTEPRQHHWIELGGKRSWIRIFSKQACPCNVVPALPARSTASCSFPVYHLA
jgi:hypothetical protein